MKAHVDRKRTSCTWKETLLVAPRVQWEWGKNCDSCCEPLSALAQFFVLLLIILLAEVTLAILLFVYEPKVSSR